MVRKRSSEGVMADMLKVAIAGAKKTKLVYRANLNFKLVEQYLEQALKTDLVEHVEATRTYHTTKKGTKFIEAYDNLEAFMQVEDEVVG